jgi:hypothetical protein
MQARYDVLSAILPLACLLFPQAAYGVVFACADVMRKYPACNLKTLRLEPERINTVKTVKTVTLVMMIMNPLMAQHTLMQIIKI